jgi:DNA-binding CsgD family transcriptional regulator
LQDNLCQSQAASRPAEHLTGHPLSAREVGVLQQAASGDGNREIGEKLFITEQTGHMNRLMDTRSDHYSLGVTLYQMLIDALPFAAADPTVSAQDII